MQQLAAEAARGGVLVVGDVNVAYLDMDIHAPKPNRNKTAGFCDGERDGFAALLRGDGGGGGDDAAGVGFVDVFRRDHPLERTYTCA